MSSLVSPSAQKLDGCEAVVTGPIVPSSELDHTILINPLKPRQGKLPGDSVASAVRQCI